MSAWLHGDDYENGNLDGERLYGCPSEQVLRNLEGNDYGYRWCMTNTWVCNGQGPNDAYEGFDNTGLGWAACDDTTMVADEIEGYQTQEWPVEAEALVQDSAAASSVPLPASSNGLGQRAALLAAAAMVVVVAALSTRNHRARAGYTTTAGEAVATDACGPRETVPLTAITI